MAIAPGYFRIDDATGAIEVRADRGRLTLRAGWLACGIVALLATAASLIPLTRGAAAAGALPLRPAAITAGCLMLAIALMATLREHVARLRSPGADLRFDAIGIFDRRIGRILPWSDIVTLRREPHRHGVRLRVVLATPARRQPWWRRWWPMLRGAAALRANELALPAVESGMLPVSADYVRMAAAPFLRSALVAPPGFDPWREEIRVLSPARVAQRLAAAMPTAAAEAARRAASDHASGDPESGARWRRVVDLLEGARKAAT